MLIERYNGERNAPGSEHRRVGRYIIAARKRGVQFEGLAESPSVLVSRLFAKGQRVLEENGIVYVEIASLLNGSPCDDTTTRLARHNPKLRARLRYTRDISTRVAPRPRGSMRRSGVWRSNRDRIPPSAGMSSCNRSYLRGIRHPQNSLVAALP